MHTEYYKEAVISSAEREAAEYLRTGKIGAELSEAVAAFTDNEGAYDIIAMLLTYTSKGDILEKMKQYAFSDARMERDLLKSESIAYENHVDARRYEMGA